MAATVRLNIRFYSISTFVPTTGDATAQQFWSSNLLLVKSHIWLTGDQLPKVRPSLA